MAKRERNDLTHDQERVRVDVAAREKDLEEARSGERELEALLNAAVARQQALARDLSDVTAEETRLNTTASHLEEELRRLEVRAFAPVRGARPRRGRGEREARSRRRSRARARGRP